MFIEGLKDTLLSKPQYIKGTMKTFGHYDNKLVVSPFDHSSHLKDNLGDSVAQLQNTRVLGSLMYIMNCTMSKFSI